MEATSTIPDVFQYLDYRQFLSDVYREARGRRGWSFRALARRAGIRSSSFLKRVMEGERNLAVPTAHRVATAVGLRDDAAEFFVSLVRFNQASSSREKSEAYGRLHRFEAYRAARPLEAERDLYHARWYHPAIRELSTSPRFRPDPEWIARVLRPPIHPKEAREALDTLERLGLLGGGDQSALVTSGRETGSVHMARFHRAMMERASESIDEVPRDERDIASITVCVPAADLARLKRRVPGDARRAPRGVRHRRRRRPRRPTQHAALPPHRPARRGDRMTRWPIVVAPALVVALAPPACIGTESGNPRCLSGSSGCPVELVLDGSLDTATQEVRAAVDGTAPEPWIRIFECPFGHDRGEFRWLREDVTLGADGAVTIRLDVSAETPVSVIVSGRHLAVTEGQLVLSEDLRISGALTVVREGVDAAVEEPSTVTIDGELDVWCAGDEPGVEIPTADGRSLQLPCNTAWERPPPCDDTGGGCS